MSDRIDKEALIVRVRTALAAVDDRIPDGEYEEWPDRCNDAVVAIEAILPDIEKLLPPEGSKVFIPDFYQGEYTFDFDNYEQSYAEWKP
jgi:hypothetical protein